MHLSVFGCSSCWPRRRIAHVTKSQSSNHLWVFTLNPNLQLLWAQGLSSDFKMVKCWMLRSRSPLFSCVRARNLWPQSKRKNLCEFWRVVFSPPTLMRRLQGMPFCKCFQNVQMTCFCSFLCFFSVSDSEWGFLESKRERERGEQWSVGALVLVYLSCTLSLNFLIGPASPVCIATCVYTNLSIGHWRSAPSLSLCLIFSSMST